MGTCLLLFWNLLLEFRVVNQGVVERTEVVQAAGVVAMLLAKRSPFDLYRLPIELLRVIERPHGMVERTEIAQCRGVLLMLFSQCLLHDL